ncbi:MULTISPECIES: DUF4041 domain-containing protein [Glycomyces]|uniref:Chromosome segregation ATPase n=2 Tax=Glycomyces TaxID=58113 RepID=A0A9X3T8V2_9ACTN|nr:DUF4041 domain-containing protein [Glycomyces lechevalierae]MDA1385693.1 DUF4041 domain-containing protein [Glycomyces lechevalierae]MDR7339812.1 chromosome segregation ATPase [Glycomyces lechevalierae]
MTAPGTPAPPVLEVNPDLQQLLTTPIRSLPGSETGGFGRKHRLEAQVTAAEELAFRLQRALIATVGELHALGALEASELTVEIERRKALIEHLDSEAASRKESITAQAQDQLHQIGLQATAANAELHRVNAELERARQSLVVTRDEALLQEVGVYEYTHPLEDAVAYKAKLESIKTDYKALAKGDKAISSVSNWQVNGSAAAGRKMVREFSKLMLRAYNADADNLVRTMRPYKLRSAVDRLQKTRETITRLGSTMDMHITDAYHRLRVQELQLTADYRAKTEEEKERIREQRAREREEEKAQRELLKEQEKLEKERAHLRSAIAKLEDNGDTAAAAELTAKLEAIDTAFENVLARQANSATGYVYVISNRGAFGANMVKIGMTRRLEPLDRVNELGDASVPFRFDVHAMVFSEDARGLESRLHETFAEHRVNKVNLRREFFHVTPQQVRGALAKLAGEHLLEYTDEPEAYEWRASGGEPRPA